MLKFIPNDQIIIKLTSEEAKRLRSIEDSLQEADEMLNWFTHTVMAMKVRAKRSQSEFWEEMIDKYRVDPRSGARLDPEKGTLTVEGIPDFPEEWSSDTTH
jgi:hypothetical protein